MTRSTIGNTNEQRFTVRRYTIEQVARARSLHAGGTSIKDIAARTDMRPQYVSRVCNGTRRKVD